MLKSVGRIILWGFFCSLQAQEVPRIDQVRVTKISEQYLRATKLQQWVTRSGLLAKWFMDGATMYSLCFGTGQEQGVPQGGWRSWCADLGYSLGKAVLAQGAVMAAMPLLNRFSPTVSVVPHCPWFVRLEPEQTALTVTRDIAQFLADLRKLDACLQPLATDPLALETRRIHAQALIHVTENILGHLAFTLITTQADPLVDGPLLRSVFAEVSRLSEELASLLVGDIDEAQLLERALGPQGLLVQLRQQLKLLQLTKAYQL